MNNFLWALKFLTIIPIDREDRIKPKNFGSVVCWFPVVGLCIGICLCMAYLLSHFFFPPIITDALVIVVYIAITGAMHLDGLADTCDGIWGGWNKEKTTGNNEGQPHRQLRSYWTDLLARTQIP